MPNCRRAAENLASAFIACDELAHWKPDVPDTLTKPELEMQIKNIKGYLQSVFEELDIRPFEGYHLDIHNLISQVEGEALPTPHFINRYAEDLQKQILSQGLLDIIDCQCGK